MQGGGFSIIRSSVSLSGNVSAVNNTVTLKTGGGILIVASNITMQY